MRKLGKTLKIIGINVLVLFLLLELLSVAVYFFQKKSFFYTDPPDRKTAGNLETANDRDAAVNRQQTHLTTKRFHPFFGYTYQPNSGKSNNYGFDCPYDYPLKRERREWYIIGIFGGSVADDFYRAGTERLKKKLTRHPFFAGREIICLNFAMGGYKQPQQLEILTYFLSIGQELDMVINIDGFNEVVFCFNNNRLNVDIAMPSAQHLLPLRDLMESRALNEEKLDSLWKIQHYRQKLNRLAKTLQHMPLASFYLVCSTYRHLLYQKYRREILHFDGLIKPVKPGQVVDSLVNIKTTPAVRNESLLLAKIASFWSRCSTIMSRSLEAQQGKSLYFHFLQPNQYQSKKVFTPEEQKNALDEHLPYNFLVKKGYPVLQRVIPLLRENHVNAFSAVEIFDNLGKTVYIDNCCHFNRLGNEVLADFIFQCLSPYFKGSSP
jgi:hypothetical protein